MGYQSVGIFKRDVHSNRSSQVLELDWTTTLLSDSQ